MLIHRSLVATNEIALVRDYALFWGHPEARLPEVWGLRYRSGKFVNVGQYILTLRDANAYSTHCGIVSESLPESLVIWK